MLFRSIDIPEICGRCHSVTAKYFKDSPHYIALSEVGAPRCIDCHGNHEILFPGVEMFSTDEEGHCGSCHEEDSVGYKTAQQIRALLETATSQVEEMEREFSDIEHSGRNLDDLQTLAEEANTYLTEVLPITHTLSLDRIKEKTDHVAENAKKHLEKVGEFKDELKARKRNLAVVLVVILITAGLLWLKRRSLDD